MRLRGSVSLVIFTLAGACEARSEPTHSSHSPGRREPEYVGSTACEPCHVAQVGAWLGSDHDRAMAATSELVADFSAPWPETGERIATVIEYGIGSAPLQQYLVETERGRLQVLPWAWDVEGRQWRDVSEPSHSWRGPAYNWNHACAECHTTGLRKQYDATRDRFATTFAELDVACEACHGPASEHLRWAAKDLPEAAHRGFEFELRGADLGAWRSVPGKPTAERLADAPPPTELDTCARCHSRRTQIHEDRPRGTSLLDTHLPALLEPPLYFEDGQIREEVYEYGSFLQSKMHGAGVTCSDCHDPHSLELRAPGNTLCGRCHDPQIFDTPAHHHHSAVGEAAACVACHMPARIYMQVDPRRDHSLRVPRPDLSASRGVPNACQACHSDRRADELARHMSLWGITPAPGLHYGEVLARARAGDSSVADELVELVLAVETALMVRATAASLLGSVTPSHAARNLAGLNAALHHPHPLVRLGALTALDGAPASARWALAAALLSDPSRAVRLAAAGLLADGPQGPLLERAVAERLASLELHADRAEARVQRGNLLVDLGRFDDAELAYAEAVTLDPTFGPAYVNWCDLLRRRGDELACAAKLAEGLERAPDSPELHHASGLSLIRQGQPRQAISTLKAAVRLAPEISAYAYVLVVALREQGERDQAATALAAARALHPDDRALASLGSHEISVE